VKPATFLIIIVCAGVVAGCAASFPPAELIDARQAYAHASAGQAPRLVPTDMYNAREALAIAERAFLDDPASSRTRDLANLAYRKARLADTLAAKANKDLQTKETDVPK
jgi:hypothetical protein